MSVRTRQFINKQHVYKYLFFCILASSLALNAWLGMLFQQIQREERALEQKQQQLVQELSQVLQETQNKEEYLNRLVNDPSFRERVIREKLGHVRENETVYIFEE